MKIPLTTAIIINRFTQQHNQQILLQSVSSHHLINHNQYIPLSRIMSNNQKPSSSFGMLMDENSNSTASSFSPIQIAVALLTIIIVMVVAAFIFQRSKGGRGKLSGGTGGGSLFSSGPSRTQLVLCGPCASGKTTLFQALIHPEQQERKPTQTSMSVNSGWISPSPFSSNEEQQQQHNPNPQKKRFEVVDCPGHLRLFDMVLESFLSAKTICIVVDGTKVQDTQNGAGSVATLLMNILTAKETAGVSSVLVACNKRDQISSFTSKALQKYIEKELKQRLSQKASEVSSSSSSTVPGLSSAGSSSKTGLKKSETLSLDENGEFDWDSAPRPVQFCDISAKSPIGKFVLDPLFEAM